MRVPAFLSLRVLGIGAISALAAAIAAVVVTAPRSSSPPAAPYFPQLESQLAAVARIHLQTKDQAVDLAFTPETHWSVATRDGYPARGDEVSRLILALAAMERAERKTKSEKWHKRLLLTDPRKNGEGTLVELADAKGAKLASVILGASADVDNIAGKGEIYARTPGDAQVWLARSEGVSTLTANPEQWLQANILDLPKEQILRVELRPTADPPFALARAAPEAPDFTVEGGTAQKLKEAMIASIADGLGALRLRDVARENHITFTATNPSLTFHVKSGLAVRLDLLKLGEDYWARLIPSAENADAKLAKEVEVLKRRLLPWVFEIERAKGEALTSTLATLTDAPPPAASDAAATSGQMPAAMSTATKPQPAAKPDRAKSHKKHK